MPIRCVRFVRYCGKMYSRHLSPGDNELWPGSRVTAQGIVGLFGGSLNAMIIANVPQTFPQSLGQLLSTQAITVFQSGLLSPVFHASVLLLIVNFVITMSK